MNVAFVIKTVVACVVLLGLFALNASIHRIPGNPIEDSLLSAVRAEACDPCINSTSNCTGAAKGCPPAASGCATSAPTCPGGCTGVKHVVCSSTGPNLCTEPTASTCCSDDSYCISASGPVPCECAIGWGAAYSYGLKITCIPGAKSPKCTGS